MSESLINFNSSKERTSGTKIWGEVTDPTKHNPQKFRYLVHAFNPFSVISQPLVAILGEIDGAYKVDKSEGDQSINLFNQPERLGERVSLSMSLIDQDHTGTWEPGGIIVEAPEENIIITSPTDIGSHNSSKEFLKKQAQKLSLLSGDQLLQLTDPAFYNEVVAFAKSDSGKTIKLAGFFIKVDKNDNPIDPVIAEKVEQHAKRLNLPVVKIKIKDAYEEGKFEISANGIWAHYNGNRYNLGSDDPEFAFYAYDDEFNSFFPSPKEIEEVINYFMKKGFIDEKQAQKIREKYKIADIQRQSPKIQYDENGRISKVDIEDGYGEDVIQYWITSSGYCWRVEMEEYKKAIRKIFLNRESTGINFRCQTPINSDEILSVLKKREEIMKPEEYQQLIGFVESIKDKIDSVYSFYKKNKNLRIF